jgi:hypothetical protein
MRTHRYRITIRGGLGRITRQAFEEFSIESNGGLTSLMADLDQAALHGALIRIQSLGIELVGFSRVIEGEGAPARADAAADHLLTGRRTS